VKTPLSNFSGIVWTGPDNKLYDFSKREVPAPEFAGNCKNRTNGDASTALLKIQEKGNW